MEYEIKIGVAVVLVAATLIIKAVYDRRTLKKRRILAAKNHFAAPVAEEYSADRMQRLAQYYLDHTGEEDIDEITWNDLDMDRLFHQMNHTCCAMGEEYLYSMLHKPLFESDALDERRRVVDCLCEQESAREQLMAGMMSMGKNSQFAVYDYLRNLKGLRHKNPAIHILQAVALLASLILLGVWPQQMILVVAGIIIVNMLTYYRAKADAVDPYLYLFRYILRMIGFCQDISKVRVDGMEEYFREIKHKAACFEKFAKGSSLVIGGDGMGGSIMDSLMDYIRMMFHIDLIKFQGMTREMILHQEDLFDLFEKIGFLDSMIGIASWKTMREDTCVPKLVQDRCSLHMEQVVHPLVTQPVANSLDTQGSILLTGSNASGKSTFLKTIAIQAILAQTVGYVTAASYEGGFFRIYSSMALRDDLCAKESYFIVEIKSLKRILNAMETPGAPVLCFVDEVLRGTNTLERIAASTQILHQISQGRSLCFAATHDIELTRLLEDEFANYHFEEQVTQDSVEFDYRLKQGPAVTRNAIRLLQMLGYDSALVRKAQDSVDRFQREGVWSKE